MKLQYKTFLFEITIIETILMSLLMCLMFSISQCTNAFTNDRQEYSCGMKTANCEQNKDVKIQETQTIVIKKKNI